MDDDILVRLREAQMFEFLTVLPSVNQAMVKICQKLIQQIKQNGAQQRPWTTIDQLTKSLHNRGYMVSQDQVQRIVDALSRHQIMVQHGKRVAFQLSVMPGSYFLDRQDRDELDHSKNQLSMKPSFNQQAQAIKEMASTVSDFGHSNQSSDASSSSSTGSNQVDRSEEPVSLSSDSFGSSSNSGKIQSQSVEVSSSSSSSDLSRSMIDSYNTPSPLSSYFSSVNTILTNQYRRSSKDSERSTNPDEVTQIIRSTPSSDDEGINSDHVISRNVRIPYASSSVDPNFHQRVRSSITSRLSSKNDRKSAVSSSKSSSSSSLSFSLATPSLESSEESSLSSSVSSGSKSLVQKNSGTARHPRHNRNYIKDIQKIYSRVHFIALISDHSKVKKIAQQEFHLVVLARKNDGIRESDHLFKYEFKMNYRKFGKVGNQINNQLMDLVSHPQGTQKS